MSDNLRKLNELERENTTLKLKMDEVQHNSKKDVANLKLEMTKERGIHNRELETLKNEIEGELNDELLYYLFKKSFFSLI